MRDTSAQMAAKMEEMFGKKTPSERLGMGCSMFDFSKKMVIASLLNADPCLSPAGLRRELFLRFYKNDFGADKQRKVLAHLTWCYE